jgi:hypothetical protein
MVGGKAVQERDWVPDCIVYTNSSKPGRLVLLLDSLLKALSFC